MLTEEEKREKRHLKYLRNKEKVLAQSKLYYEENKNLVNLRHAQYRKLNKEKIIELNKIYGKKNRAKITLYERKRKTIDPLYKLSTSIRTLIYISFKTQNHVKSCKTVNILGCSFDELKTYLESKFETWMNWENKGLYNKTPNYGWDVDHIIPLSSAKSEEDIIRLNHYTNLQPLCSYINRDVKINKLDW